MFDLLGVIKLPATCTFHSYKGGTGKSLISLNVAVQLAKMGKKVCLMDFDFLGPSLFTIFKENGRYLNDAIYGSRGVEDVLIQYKHDSLPEPLMVGLADPEPNSIEKINQLRREDLQEAFDRTMEAQEILEDDFKIDFIIIDTGPGLRMDVANAVMISDVIGLILKPTLSDLEGTKRMVMAMLQNYAKDKAKGLILNRALQKSWQSGAATVPEANTEYEDLIYNIRQFSEDTSTSIYSILPCLCDVSRAQSDRILVLDYPDHPFCKGIAGLTERLINETGGQ